MILEYDWNGWKNLNYKFYFIIEIMVNEKGLLIDLFSFYLQAIKFIWECVTLQRRLANSGWGTSFKKQNTAF